jgi:hypothetical protein
MPTCRNSRTCNGLVVANNKRVGDLRRHVAATFIFSACEWKKLAQSRRRFFFAVNCRNLQTGKWIEALTRQQIHFCEMKNHCGWIEQRVAFQIELTHWVLEQTSMHDLTHVRRTALPTPLEQRRKLRCYESGFLLPAISVPWRGVRGGDWHREARRFGSAGVAMGEGLGLYLPKSDASTAQDQQSAEQQREPAGRRRCVDFRSSRCKLNPADLVGHIVAPHQNLADLWRRNGG